MKNWGKMKVGHFCFLQNNWWPKCLISFWLGTCIHHSHGIIFFVCVIKIARLLWNWSKKCLILGCCWKLLSMIGGGKDKKYDWKMNDFWTAFGRPPDTQGTPMSSTGVPTRTSGGACRTVRGCLPDRPGVLAGPSGGAWWTFWHLRSVFMCFWDGFRSHECTFGAILSCKMIPKLTQKSEG